MKWAEIIEFEKSNVQKLEDPALANRRRSFTPASNTRTSWQVCPSAKLRSFGSNTRALARERRTLG